MLSNTSKMPGKSINLDAFKCITGSILAAVEGSVCEDCYARKGAYRFPVVKNKMLDRMNFFNASNFIPAMVMNLDKTKNEYFRWFDSGDLDSINMLEKIVMICQATPTIKHWLPTREVKVVSDYLKIYKEFPDNLLVRVSSPMIDGEPLKFEYTSTVHHKEKAKGHDCPSRFQNNECRDCRACWNKNIKNVSYHKH